MELSQTALAVMLFCAAPLGILLNVVYRLTEPRCARRAKSHKAVIVVLQNLKDFIFLIAAAVLVVLLVYYANDGQFRYLALAGALAGYWFSDRLLAKPILVCRDALCRLVVKVMRVLLVPVVALWRITVGKGVDRAQNKAIIQKTDQRASWWTVQASSGFEDTEAKEWKKKKNNRIRS